MFAVAQSIFLIVVLSCGWVFLSVLHCLQIVKTRSSSVFSVDNGIKFMASGGKRNLSSTGGSTPPSKKDKSSESCVSCKRKLQRIVPVYSVSSVVNGSTVAAQACLPKPTMYSVTIPALILCFSVACADPKSP